MKVEKEQLQDIHCDGKMLWACRSVGCTPTGGDAEIFVLWVSVHGNVCKTSVGEGD